MKRSSAVTVGWDGSRTVFDSKQALQSKIRLGEDSFLEYKEVRFSGSKIQGPHRDSLADELASFANSRGGVFVLGVDDRTHEVLGIPVDRLDAVEQFVSGIVQDSITPPLQPVIERIELPDASGRDRPVIRIEVQPSLFVHESSGGYLHRVGSSKRRMEPDYLARLFQQRSQSRLIRFDEQAVHTAVFEELEPQSIERFRIDGSRDDLETLAHKLGMLARSRDDQRHPTVTGILMGTEQPERWLPHAYIQAVAYRGRDLPKSLEEQWYQVDARDITGPLDRQVTEACRFVSRNQRVRARKTIGRADQPQYDMTAVFEAVVNAVAHRDYSMHGSRIRLHMFSDRIDLYSPGSLPNTMTVDDLAYRQSSRNETLTSLLARCPVPTGIPGLDSPRTTLMDRRGNGVPIILESSRRLSGMDPVYELIGDAELRLTIFAADNHSGDTPVAGS